MEDEDFDAGQVDAAPTELPLVELFGQPTVSAIAVAKVVRSSSQDEWQPIIDGILDRGPDEDLVLALLADSFQDATLTQFTTQLVWPIIQTHYVNMSKPTVKACVDYLQGSYFNWFPLELYTEIAQHLPAPARDRVNAAKVGLETGLYEESDAARQERSHYAMESERWATVLKITEALIENVSKEPTAVGESSGEISKDLATMFDRLRSEISDAHQILAGDLRNPYPRTEALIPSLITFFARTCAGLGVLIAELAERDSVPLAVLLRCETAVDALRPCLDQCRTEICRDHKPPGLEALAPIRRSCDELIDRMRTQRGRLLKQAADESNSALLRRWIAEARANEIVDSLSDRFSHARKYGVAWTERIPLLLDTAPASGIDCIWIRPAIVQHRGPGQRWVKHDIQVHILCSVQYPAREVLKPFVNAILHDEGLPECYVF